MDKFTREEMDTDANTILALSHDQCKILDYNCRVLHLTDLPIADQLRTRQREICLKYRNAGCSHDRIYPHRSFISRTLRHDGGHYVCRLCCTSWENSSALPTTSKVIDLFIDEV